MRYKTSILSSVALLTFVIAVASAWSGSNKELPASAHPPPSINQCLTKSMLLIDRERTKPAVDPTTCFDLTPIVGLVRAKSLPQDLRAADAGWLLFYVPPTDDDGRRRVTLSGNPACNPDPCIGAVECGRPTEEKCAPPDRTSCASQIDLPGDNAIYLSDRSMQMKLGDSSPLVERAYSGVLIAANEIIVSGHVRTNGTDLLLMAQRIVGQGADATVDVSSLRQARANEPQAGGNLVVLAEQIEAPAGLMLRASGSPGALPTTLYEGHGIHSDCVREGINLYGSPECFPCDGHAGLCDAGKYKVILDSTNERCVTHTREWIDKNDVGHFQYIADHPPAPIQLPPTFASVAPGGGDGGVPGRIILRYRWRVGPLHTVQDGGEGAPGLEGYRIYSYDQHYCPEGTLKCSIDKTGARWTTAEGPVGKTPVLKPTFSAWRPVGPQLAQSSGISEKPAISAWHPGGPQLKQHFDVDQRFIAQTIAEVVGEFMLADEQLHLAELACRGGLLSQAKTHYEAALVLLGDLTDYACPTDRYRALRAEAKGRIEQIDAGLDFQGQAPYWAPYTAPGPLQTLVLSELQHATNVAIDIKLNALVSMASSQQQAAIAQALNQADGELAALEAVKNALSLKEKETRLEELLVYVALAQQQVPALHNALMAHWATLAEPPEGLFDAIVTVGSKAMDFIGKIKDVVSGWAFTNFGEFFQLLSSVGKAAESGYAFYQAIDELGEKLGAETTCATDANCQALMVQVQRARLQLYAARRAVLAADYALRAEQANIELFEARRRASRDAVRTLQNNAYEVRSFSHLARAGVTLCRYGQLLVDDAAADLFAFKRAAALWDVPDPAADASAYGGTGNNYAYDFNELLDENCQANNCTLWGEYNHFLSERLNHVVPNANKLYLGTQSDSLGPSLAALLGHTTQIEVEDKDGSSLGTRRRAEIELGVFATAVGPRFGARSSNLAIAQGAPDNLPLLNGVDLTNHGALQVHGITVSGTTTQNQPLRIDLPWRISRPSVERYVSQLNLPVHLEANVAVPMGRETDGGFLTDPLLHELTSNSFKHMLCCDQAGNPLARPESLHKPWLLWVPVCGPADLPGQTCATAQELQGIANVHISVDLRYKLLAN